MDGFSSSVSTLKIPSVPATTNREFHHQFTRTPHVTSNIPNLVPQKTKTTFSHKNTSFPSQLPFTSSSKTSPLKLKPPPSSLTFHHKPATGYAAAIIDVAQNTNSLHSVQRDVHRLLMFLQHLKKFQSDGVVDVEEVKGKALRKVMVEQQGNFHGHVAVLVKMLMKKKKMGMIEQVLEEFERIYDELCGTQVVLVSSPNRMMGKDEIFGIAKSVQQLSGSVRVKVRNLVQQQAFPSFAK